MQDGMFGDFHAILNRFYSILQKVSGERNLHTVFFSVDKT